MCGGVVPQYTIAETETWSCLSVPPPAVRQLHTSIELPIKGDVCRSRRNVLGSPAIWNSRTYPRCGWRDVAAAKVRDVE